MNIVVDENIRLESTAQNHAAKLFNAINNNRTHLSKYLPWVDSMQSVEDAEVYIEKCELLFRQKEEVSFVIMYKDKLVGRIGLHHMNLQNKIAAIGYWQDKGVEGQGIITKSCIALINYGFEDLGLHRIEIKAATNNLKSQAIPERLNFKKEGILRQAELVNNEYLDLVLFSMLSHEWTGN
jgi:ribosomal-protein-serine acetyltransferase